MQERPALSFWQIWNMSFGFFGIQFGWALQLANMSAIYRFLGAEEESIPLLWLAAPLTGLIVQPIIGYYSDRTWTGLGRRRPYFLVGAICASIALVAMPNSSALWMAAGLLWILDASINITMEPFRAFVGDMLPKKQRKIGFAMQSLLIGMGAVVASALPWLLTHVFGISGEAQGDSAIPWTVHVSFYAGAALFFCAVFYTIFTTKEYPPEDIETFKRMKAESSGLMNAFKEILQGILTMPKVMRQLAKAQFFTWFALFCMWIYFTPAITNLYFASDPGSPVYLRGLEWGGVCFSVYNGVAFGFAFILLFLVRFLSAKYIHIACLVFGGAGLLSVGWFPQPESLLVSMVGVGIAWASILSMPYAMLSNSVPPARMGFYMGVFNFFLVIPQILASTSLGWLVSSVFDGEILSVVRLGGASLLFAAILMFFVSEET